MHRHFALFVYFPSGGDCFNGGRCVIEKQKKLGIGDVEFFGVGVDGFEPPTLCL